MSRDTDLAAALVTALQAGTYTKTPTFSFSFEEITDAESATTTPTVWVRPSALSHERRSRNDWSEDSEIELVVHGRQQGQDTTEVTAWLTFCDELIDVLRDAQPSGRKSTEIENEERYDRDMLINKNLFLTTLRITYTIFEV